MCGIAGFVDLVRGIGPEDGEILRMMTSTLAHRGPDADGFFLDDHVALGHRRLSIIDVAGGNQPIGTGDGSVQIIFNGQIYNYREIRARLEDQGHCFRTRSDTEVIVHLYQEEGNRCVESLRGMFAFAIWDASRRKLLLARDRLGIKPLYHSALPSPDGRMWFGSELKAILAGWPGSREVDPASVLEFLTFLYVPSGRSIFRGIRKLPPAHWLEVTPEGSREERYWDLSFQVEDQSEQARLAALEEELRRSVSLRLMSEVPLGAFLSSGTDSSAVVWAMTRAASDPVRTVTVGFGDARFDEREGARAVAQHLRTDHREVEVSPEALPTLEKLAWHYDEPFADSSMIPTYYVSRAARERVTVALSGDGGDENFAGYRRYRFDVLENRLRARLPGLACSLVGAVGGLWPKADWLPRPLRAKTFLTHLGLDPVEAYYRSVAPVAPAIRDRLLCPDFRGQAGDYDPLDRIRDIHSRCDSGDPLSRIQYLDLMTYLPDDILTKVDRASMAVSLEVRVPLLDHRLVELAARMPSSVKLAGSTGKWILRQLLRQKLPAAVVDGPKRGFSVPLRRWVRHDLAPWIEERVMESPLPWLHPPEIERLWREHRAGTGDHSTVLFGLLSLHLWHDRFAGQGALH